MSETKEGWTWLINSRKDHYFRDCKSLCGKWMIFGSNSLEKGMSNNACATCKKKLEKEKLEKEKHEH